MPQFLLLGNESDVQDIVRAVEKVVMASAELAKAVLKLAGLKACSRALRAKMERMKNFSHNAPGRFLVLSAPR